jgi:hypothetical protein
LNNFCPFAPAPDAAARWDAFARSLASQGLLDTVAAFYPLDEPDRCGLSDSQLVDAVAIIHAHPLTAGKPVAAIFSCDIAQKYGGLYDYNGGHEFGPALRAYDWVGFDCYGVGNIFTDPAWHWLGRDGPSYYDNFKAQLDLPRQQIMLVPQASIGDDVFLGAPDDPQLFASKAASDLSVILMLPFTWFDLPDYPGVRSQPALAAQWRSIGAPIAHANPPAANPPLPAAVVPRLQVTATDVAHFAVYDLDCNTSNAKTCTIRLHWQIPSSNTGAQLSMRANGGGAQVLGCFAQVAQNDIPIAQGNSYVFDIVMRPDCTSSLPVSGQSIASLNVALLMTMPPTLGSPDVAPNGNFFPYAGGNGQVAVTANSGAAWLTASDASWLTVKSGASGAGNGNVTFSVAANTGNAQRVGTLTIAGQTFTVTQLGLPEATSVPIIEYHNSAQDDYFITADPAEQRALDAAALAGAVWSRTGMSFNSGGNASVYRFIYRSPSGTNTHFYTVNTSEQSSLLANNPIWVLESPAAFYMTAANASQTCPAGTVPVYRAANEQTGSHRFTTIQSAVTQVLARGWANEGVAFCAPQ